MTFTPLALLAVATAAIATLLQIRAEYRGPRWQVYLFKPFSTTILLLLAALSPPVHGPRYHLAITIGLALSLVGDVALMLPRDRFIQGLACFLAAQLAYVAAFTTGVPLGTAPAILLVLVAAALPVLRLLWPGLGGLRAPVLVYALVILLMAWSAWARVVEMGTTGAVLAGLGATLFMISDAVLALNRFRRPFPQAEAVLLGTYVTAQACIALSSGTM